MSHRQTYYMSHRQVTRLFLYDSSIWRMAHLCDVNDVTKTNIDVMLVYATWLVYVTCCPSMWHGWCHIAEHILCHIDKKHAYVCMTRLFDITHLCDVGDVTKRNIFYVTFTSNTSMWYHLCPIDKQHILCHIHKKYVYVCMTRLCYIWLVYVT